uniref:Ovule protein n=1 Tax=Mesocestoides corti TaxID=53468 RepID=A0A5K3F8Z2_MESCO
VKYPRPSLKNTGTTYQALLTSNKAEPYVRHRPFGSTKPATPLIVNCSSFESFSGCLHIFLACHWNAERHRIG